MPDLFADREVDVPDSLASGSSARCEATDISVLGIDRQLLIGLQRHCPFTGSLLTVKPCELEDKPCRGHLLALQECGTMKADRKIDTAVQESRKYELVNGILDRAVYDVLDGECQLRPVARDGDWEVTEDVGRGLVSKAFRVIRVPLL